MLAGSLLAPDHQGWPERQSGDGANGHGLRLPPVPERV